MKQTSIFIFFQGKEYILVLNSDNLAHLVDPSILLRYLLVLNFVFPFIVSIFLGI